MDIDHLPWLKLKVVLTVLVVLSIGALTLLITLIIQSSLRHSDFVRPVDDASRSQAAYEEVPDFSVLNAHPGKPALLPGQIWVDQKISLGADVVRATRVTVSPDNMEADVRLTITHATYAAFLQAVSREPTVIPDQLILGEKTVGSMTSLSRIYLAIHQKTNGIDPVGILYKFEVV